MLIWHIDEGQTGNTDENHYKVALMQADGRRDLEMNNGRGDPGDPYPGSRGNTAFDGASMPNSNSYGHAATSVAVTAISPPGPTINVSVAVV